LWQADERTLFASPVAAPPRSWSHLQTTLSGLSVPERVRAVFPLIERANPRTYDLSPAGFVRTAVDVLRWYATLLVNASKPGSQPLHLYVAKALKAPSGFEETIRQLLVLAADHEFDPITYAVRATANVGVTPYQAVITGLIASQGQRFQAERSAPAMRFLEEILGSRTGTRRWFAVCAAARRCQDSEAIPVTRIPAPARSCIRSNKCCTAIRPFVACKRHKAPRSKLQALPWTSSCPRCSLDIVLGCAAMN
jgi:hypothetical protein